MSKSDDTISRQDAVEAFTNFIWVDYQTRELAQESAEMVMGQVPSAEPKTKCIAQIRIDLDDIKDLINEKVNEIVDKMEEPKTGKWVKATGVMPPEFHGHHCCSECGAFANMDAPFGNREALSRYCPNCGAKMKGESSE